MRASLFGTFLLLAATSPCLGWSPDAAPAGGPGTYPMPGNCAVGGQGQCAYPAQQQCMEPAIPCEAPGECGPCWTITAEGIAMQRTTTRSQALFVNNPQSPPVDPLYSQNLNFPVTYGAQVSAIRHDIFGSCFDLEVAYFQLDGFDARSDVPGASLMVTDVGNTGFTVTNGTARYTSALYSGEVNLRRQCTDWLTLLAGFRMGELNEHYRGSGTDFITQQTDSLGINTYNHLYGLQLGAEMEVYNMAGPLVIDTFCKGGVFGNVAHQDYSRNFSGTAFDSFSAVRNQAAFLGEAGVVATYAVTKRLAFRASAEAMWLTGVALAPEQIGSVNLRTRRDLVNTSGAVFYYGGGLGAEYRY